MALATGRAGLDEFSDASVARAPAQGLAARLRFVDDTHFAVEAAQVTLHLQGGREIARRVDMARGSLQAPLSDRDLERKLDTLCAWGGSGCDAGRLAQAVWALDDAQDAGAVMALAAGRH
jgi:2-methylcitrate dehydratase PrpD